MNIYVQVKFVWEGLLGCCWAVEYSPAGWWGRQSCLGSCHFGSQHTGAMSISEWNLNWTEVAQQVTKGNIVVWQNMPTLYNHLWGAMHEEMTIFEREASKTQKWHVLWSNVVSCLGVHVEAQHQLALPAANPLHLPATPTPATSPIAQDGLLSSLSAAAPSHQLPLCSQSASAWCCWKCLWSLVARVVGKIVGRHTSCSALELQRIATILLHLEHPPGQLRLRPH